MKTFFLFFIAFMFLQAGSKMNVTVSAFYSMIDGKVANAVNKNNDTHKCPLCVDGADNRIGPSFYHCRLNCVEWLIRVSGQLHIPGHPAQKDTKVKEKRKEITRQLEDHFNLLINRPKIGGSGSSNNGNTARTLLADPKNFSAILGIDQKLVENLRMISSLALSSKYLDAEKVGQLYTQLEQQIWKQFPFLNKKIPPSMHKYSHLPEFIERLVIIMQNFL